MAGIRRFVPRRDHLVAASLVGAVVVVVGFASGMGIRQHNVGTSTLPARSGTPGQTDEYQVAIPGEEAPPGLNGPGPVIPAIGPVGFGVPIPGGQPAGAPPVEPVPGLPEAPGQPAPPAEEPEQPPSACRPGVLQVVVGTVVTALGGPAAGDPGPAPEPGGGLVYDVVRGLVGTCPPLIQPGSGT